MIDQIGAGTVKGSPKMVAASLILSLLISSDSRFRTIAMALRCSVPCCTSGGAGQPLPSSLRPADW